MPRSRRLLLILAFAGVSVACSTARNPSKGFRLAPSGDIQRGKAAFLEFGCNNCHDVSGSALPKRTAQPITTLGGTVMRQHSDGYLVTAIINPAFHAAHYPIANVAQGGNPHMPDFASRMTVRQLTDIVSYLQSRYALFPMQVTNEYP